MIHLTNGILLVVEYGLAVFCFVDIVRSPEAAVPWMPRWGWIIAVLFVAYFAIELVERALGV